MRFVSRDDLRCGAVTHALFSGAMRTAPGSFPGYASPLPPFCAHAADELEEWGTASGRHLADHGYAGPFGPDALVDADGVAYASESKAAVRQG